MEESCERRYAASNSCEWHAIGKGRGVTTFLHIDQDWQLKPGSLEITEVRIVT